MSADPIKTAYRACDLLRVCALAAESEAPAMPGDDRALADTITSAGALVGSILDTLEAAQRTTGAQEGQDRPSTAIAQWKALIAQRDALVTSNGGGDSETPEFATIEAQEATLSERICNLTPATQQDAAAMLEWLLIDSARLQVFHPDYETALRNVIAYLASGSTH